MGYLIHPLVEDNLSDNAAVIDVVCGTGIWAIGVAISHPHAPVDGIDICNAMFPFDDHQPPNLQLSCQDMKAPFPTDLLEKYDLVHVRLVVGAMQNDN